MMTVDAKRVLLHKVMLAQGWSEAFAGMSVMGANSENVDSLLEIALAGFAPAELRGEVELWYLERAESLMEGGN